MLTADSLLVSLFCNASSSCLISFSNAASHSLASISIASSSFRGSPSVNRDNDGAIRSFTSIHLDAGGSKASCGVVTAERPVDSVVESIIMVACRL